MSDILDVFNVSRESSERPMKKKKPERKEKRPVGAMQRELYSLLGENTPGLQLSAPVSKFKQRLGSKSKPAAWRREKFVNHSRNDGLELVHWVKGPKSEKYAFEQYNQKLKLPEMNLDVWEKLGGRRDDLDGGENDGKTGKSSETSSADVKMNDNSKKDGELEVGNKNEDEGNISKEDSVELKEEREKQEEEAKMRKQVLSWSYKETKYLFDMCNKYDLRWPIISDRYDTENPEFAHSERTQEDLKQQFYGVCKMILSEESRILKESGIVDDQKLRLIASLDYSKEKEVSRKKYLERLLARSPAEIAEEESLVIEARRFEQAAQKMLQERAALLNVLDSPTSSASINQYLSSQGLAQLYNNLMFNGAKKPRESPQTTEKKPLKKPTPSQESTTSSVNTIQGPVAQLLQKRLTPQEEAAYGISYHTERLQPGVHLRSAKITAHKSSVQSKVDATLNELGISSRPVILSAKIVERFDTLTSAVATMLEMKKQLDKMETEARLVTS